MSLAKFVTWMLAPKRQVVSQGFFLYHISRQIHLPTLITWTPVAWFHEICV